MNDSVISCENVNKIKLPLMTASFHRNSAVFLASDSNVKGINVKLVCKCLVCAISTKKHIHTA